MPSLIALVASTVAGLSRPALAAGIDVEVGIRVGFQFDGGFLLGLGAAAGWGGLLDRTSGHGGVFRIGGNLGADLLLNPKQGHRVYLHAGPHLAGVLPCPAGMGRLSAGPVLRLGGGEPARWGWQVGATAVVDAVNSEPSYNKPPSEPQALAGLFYRYARIDDHAAQALGLTYEMLTLPFDGRDRGVGSCGGG